MIEILEYLPHKQYGFTFQPNGLEFETQEEADKKIEEFVANGRNKADFTTRVKREVKGQAFPLVMGLEPRSSGELTHSERRSLWKSGDREKTLRLTY